MGVPIVIGSAYLAGAIPFSNIAARRARGVDLRAVGTGTVSGTSLYKVAGFVPLAVAGVFDVAKGAVGPVLAGDRPLLAAVAGGVAVVGHDWSPFLRGAGGRGVAPTLGALLVNAWPGAVLVLVAMLLGWATKQTGLGTFIGMVLLVPVLGALYGSSGAIAGAAVAAPMFVKRIAGNSRPVASRAPTYVTRLVFDRDARQQA
ncbi:MAG: glycerol-3-phosphate acyltransferase [Acidimicrobiia bacterium]